MSSVINPFTQSPLGAFVQSPLGARGAGVLPCMTCAELGPYLVGRLIWHVSGFGGNLVCVNGDWTCNFNQGGVCYWAANVAAPPDQSPVSLQYFGGQTWIVTVSAYGGQGANPCYFQCPDGFWLRCGAGGLGIGTPKTCPPGGDYVVSDPNGMIVNTGWTASSGHGGCFPVLTYGTVRIEVQP